ncbi:PA4780 family RIO1-like protein kinase [Marinagarivorans cellulosilyticus]|uniref:non-specific serine/threonine protein kinase n=1 Tax=Marinagarivorans cellulosilyticus TaxID=2721545 RepID=A0AAN2BL72_9GAMM|nr:PA4780 family RIO1-like protein kinase [Marinagarivorans cellulosilyticus]BCD98823.1 RIO kinase 1 [Marinagarivorans cellulosilyticus]
MKMPKRLKPLFEDGLIDDVISSLMSGKEASVYVVRCGDITRAAKVYKDAAKRSFKKAVQYQEGRKVRNSRRQRAMEKGSKFGRDQQEEAWQSAESDALVRVANAGVRVPNSYGCYDGVLLMDLIATDDGSVAPRLNDVTMSAEQAIEDHTLMMHYIMRMLSVGIVHGDLSEFNVLVDDYGPVIIDLPQAVDAAGNNNAHGMFVRDVDNITNYYAQFAPELKHTQYASEIWSHFEEGTLDPDMTLTGQFEAQEVSADVDSVLEEIKAAFAEEQERQERIRSADQPDD